MKRTSVRAPDRRLVRLPDRVRALRRTSLVATLAVVAAVAVPALTYLVLRIAFDVLSGRVPRVVVALVAVLVGVVGVFAAYAAVDVLLRRLPRDLGTRVQPYAWTGPAISLVTVFLVYPAVSTIRLSFRDATGDAFVGLANYRYVLTDPSMLRSMRNTLLWIFVVPATAIVVGLGFAVLADRLRRLEALAKSLIFLPMAISFVGAGIIWRFVYSFRLTGGSEQIGLLNAIWTRLGGQPVDWLSLVPWNNLFLMVILVWLMTGFAMVVLSAAIKAVPEDLIESARVDGASEYAIFRFVVLPSISASIAVVFSTMAFIVLNVFDIVWVMTGGQNGTEVIAERMLRNMFTFRHFGRGAAIAVFMFVAVVPIMILNVRRFREADERR